MSVDRKCEGGIILPILTFKCPKCENPMGFDYADYDLRDALVTKNRFIITKK